MSLEKRIENSLSISEFDENGYAICTDMEHQQFFIDQNGKKLSRSFDELIPFHNGVAYGIMETHHTTLKDEFSYVFMDSSLREYCYGSVTGIKGEVNSNGLVWVEMGDSRWALFNPLTGNCCTELFDYVDEPTESGITVVARDMEKNEINGHYGPYEFAIVDGKGEYVVGFDKYKFIGRFSNGYANFSNGGRYVASMSNSADYLLGRRESEVSDRGSFQAAKALFGYINEQGEVVISPRWVEAGKFTEHGYAYVREDKNYWTDNRKIINTKGEYTYTLESKASLKYEGRWAFFERDKDNNLVVMDTTMNKRIVKEVNPKAKIGVYQDLLGEYVDGAIKLYRMEAFDSFKHLLTLENTRPKDVRIMISSYKLDLGSYREQVVEYMPSYEGNEVKCIEIYKLNDKRSMNYLYDQTVERYDFQTGDFIAKTRISSRIGATNKNMKYMEFQF